jgi:predicted DNA-binding transcriptional regulator AlpA
MATKFSNPLPDIIFIEQLSQLIGKATTTIRTCATNAKYFNLIPKPSKMPASRRLFWTREEVDSWLNRSTTVNPVKRSGRPTKRDKLLGQREQNRIKARTTKAEA